MVATTTHEMKWGRNIIDWATFLKCFLVISFKIIAKPTSNMTPKDINATLYKSVFLVKGHSFLDKII